MEWLVVGLVALVVVHELSVYGLARALGAVAAIALGDASGKLAAGGAPVMLTVNRGGTRHDLTIQPTRTDGRWLLCFAVAYVPETVSDVGIALPRALEPKRIVDELQNVDRVRAAMLLRARRS